MVLVYNKEYKDMMSLSSQSLVLIESKDISLANLGLICTSLHSCASRSFQPLQGFECCSLCNITLITKQHHSTDM